MIKTAGVKIGGRRENERFTEAARKPAELHRRFFPENVPFCFSYGNHRTFNFRESLRCQPDDAEVNDNLGNLLFQRGVYKEVAFYFEKAIDADPTFAEAHHHFGRLLVVMNEVPLALEELNEAGRLSAGDFQIHEDLADVLVATGHAGEAAAQYARVLELKPNYPKAELGLGMALLEQHRPAEARQHLDAAAQGPDPETARRANALLAQYLR